MHAAYGLEGSIRSLKVIHMHKEYHLVLDPGFMDGTTSQDSTPSVEQGSHHIRGYVFI